MDFLGVGPMELFFVVIIALIILGPKDMQKTGRTLGKWLNSLVRSDTWKMVKQASNKIKYLPNELMREAGIEELNKIGKDISADINKKSDIGFDDPFESWKRQEADPKSDHLPSHLQQEISDKNKTEEKTQIDNDKGDENINA